MVFNDDGDVRDSARFELLQNGGKAVASFLAECERRLHVNPQRVMRDAQRLIRQGRGQKAAYEYVGRALPARPRDPLASLGQTNNDTLSAGILAAVHDYELNSEVDAHFRPLVLFLGISKKERTVHHEGRIVGRRSEPDDHGLEQIFRWFSHAEGDGKNLARILRVSKHLTHLVKRTPPSGKLPRRKRQGRELNESLTDSTARGKPRLTFADGERMTGINRGTIKRAADKGEIQCNGREGRKRWMKTASFTVWALNRARRGETQESNEAVERKLRDAGV